MLRLILSSNATNSLNHDQNQLARTLGVKFTSHFPLCDGSAKIMLLN